MARRAFCVVRDSSPGTESVISHKEESELLSQLNTEVLSVIAEMGLVPLPVLTKSGKLRGASQAGVEISMPAPIGGTGVVWVGHYPGFAGRGGPDFQISLSTEAESIRWGVDRDGVKSFLATGLIPRDAVKVARKATDLKSLKG